MRTAGAPTDAGGAVEGEPARRDVSRGLTAVFAAAVLWGSIGVLSVGLFRAGVSPWEVAFWRAALSTAALLAYLLLRDRGSLHPGSMRDLALLTGFGVVAVGLFYASFQLATFLTSVAVAVVLLYTAPAIVMIAARLLLGEALDGWKLIMVAAVITGVVATTLGAAGAEVRISAMGMVWGVLAAFSYASYYIFGRLHLARLGILRTLFFSLLAGTLVLGPAAVASGNAPNLAMGAGSWALLLALSLGTTLLANGLYYWGIARAEAGRASIVASVEPVVAAFLALLIFGQSLTPVGWLGVALVVGGVAGIPALRRFLIARSSWPDRSTRPDLP